MIIKNKNILIIALIALVNMLGYGIIIPLMYGYSKKFGLSDFENGMLFAVYSVFQFISTPIIGRMSDKYGRRPMLIISILGTAASFFLMAFAPNSIVLFLARALDGLTAGNIPVAFAVISDSTKPEERAKAFGTISSAFNFGFIFGPAIAAFTVSISTALPFIIAGIVTVLAAVLTFFYLPETNAHMGEVKEGKLFDLPKLWHALFDPAVGMTFLISLLFFFSFAAALIYGFQPFTMNVLHLSDTANSYLFTLFGIIGLITQNLIVGRFSNKLGIKKAFSTSILFTALSFLIIAISHSVAVFVLGVIILALFNGIAQTLIPTILSQETDAKSQGSMMGISSSYQSIGMIIGPIAGGGVATLLSIRYPFLLACILIFVCFLLSFKVLRPNIKQESAF